MYSIINNIASRQDFFKGKGTLEIGYPWLSFGAIMALESIVNKNLKILEFGSGGSTVFWAKNCQSVKSFETNRQWYEKVCEKTKKFKNVEIILADQAETLKKLDMEPDNYYDIILVDSYPKDIERILIANTATKKVKANGWLIIDNYQNFGMQKFTYPKNCEIYTFDEFKYSGKGTRFCKILP